MNNKITNELNELIGSAAHNEKDSFRLLCEHYEPLISSAVRRFCPENASDMAEDLRQEAALALFRAACTYEASRSVSFGAYAKVCIENSLCSQLRMRRADTDTLDEFEESMLAGTDPDPSEVCIGREAADSILKIIDDSLSSFEKKVFSLYILQLPTLEIATALGTSEKSVENAVYRIRIKLKKLLVDKYM
jgi:RNA polymerase sporulation-specific sigma factor